MHPDRIVIGSFDEASGDRVAALYDGFDAPVVRTSVASAEMIKLAANAFLATRISFINEIANVSEAVGANVDEVALRDGPRPADRDELPQPGHRLRRQLLPEGRVLSQAARREQRLPLPARERRDRGQRPPEAARRDEAPAAARQPARQDDRAPRARVQAGHGRHARGAVARARGATAGRRSRRPRLGSARQGPSRARRRRRRSFAARRGAGCRRGRDRDRVGRAARSSLRPRCATRCARR